MLAETAQHVRDAVTPTKLCKGNNGFGNDGGDGSPNGKEDVDR
jgi:hypothetical protein